eukprot:6173853-Pleurochrysis_carterae.AAC.3
MRGKATPHRRASTFGSADQPSRAARKRSAHLPVPGSVGYRSRKVSAYPTFPAALIIAWSNSPKFRLSRRKEIPYDKLAAPRAILQTAWYLPCTHLAKCLVASSAKYEPEIMQVNS